MFIMEEDKRQQDAECNDTDSDLALRPQIQQLQQLQQFAQNLMAKNLYILFNSANHPELPQQYYSLDPEQQYTGLLQEILEGYNEQSIPVMPYLVQITPENIADNQFIHWLFSTPEAQSSFFVLSSDFNLEEVAGHWDSIALAYNSHQQSVILRLFDGRIGQQFFPQISQADKQALMGPCRTLWFPNATENEEALQIDNTADWLQSQNQSQQQAQQQAPWFHLTEQHEQLLAGEEDSSLTYNLTLYLWDKHPQSLSQYPLESIDPLIALGLKKAQALGFRLTSSICQCVALFFDYSPSFYRHEAISALWLKEGAKNIDSDSSDEHTQLLMLSEKITDLQWQQIAQHKDMDDWLDMPEKPIASIQT
ncbi:DUF4123 domain-containing protein [sulfur-oxidizing endosymbiont of Gigantopelta aegis]|uniref:DUF4123 domain-containing protein n=1 Tax=sulfur-oxidizing endosymbiont of Gigantopelta aegis TaxID=2794934 RepID=UPI0018DD0E6F|nr:DUF4123 domain-containing protein [sulfur-oxidizing endosymbiont of Gigantopelta aegis]